MMNYKNRRGKAAGRGISLFLTFLLIVGMTPAYAADFLDSEGNSHAGVTEELYESGNSESENPAEEDSYGLGTEDAYIEENTGVSAPTDETVPNESGDSGELSASDLHTSSEADIDETAEAVCEETAMSSLYSAVSAVISDAADTEEETDGDIAPREAAAYSEERTENSVMSLSSGEKTYYFDSVQTAFEAAGDGSLSGDVAFTVLADAAAVYSERTVYFSAADGTVTIDLNGRALTLSAAEDAKSSIDVQFNCRSLTVTDSAAAESEQASGELKTENVRLTGGTALKSLNVKDVKCSFGGELLTAGMNSSSLTEVNIADAVIERSGSSKSQPALAIGGSKCIGTVTDSVISNDCGAGISISGSGGVWTLQDCDISASADAVLMSGNSSSIEIDGGRYTSETNAISTGSYSGNKAILKDGVFTGALYVGRASGSAIEIREGYYKGNFAGTGSANITAPHSIASEGDGEYEGYTKYTLRPSHTADITVSGAAAASLSVETGKQTVYEGESVAYTVTCIDDYSVSKITYTPAGGTSQVIDSTSYTVDGLNTVYTMTIPSCDYSLDFYIEADDVEGTAAFIGDTPYASLSSALISLKDGDTLKLNKDVGYSSVISFSQGEITLDLNGHTLSMDSGAASAYQIEVLAGKLTVTDSQDDEGTISFGGHYGVCVSGEGACFELEAGSLRNVNISTVAYAVSCTAASGSVLISGGIIVGRIGVSNATARIDISGGRIQGVGNSSLVVSASKGMFHMTGGEIFCGSDVSENTDAVPVVNLIGADATIIGGKIVSEISAVPVRVNSSSGTVEIGGTADISGMKSVGLEIYGVLSNCSTKITIEDDAAIAGNVFSMNFVNPFEAFGVTAYYPLININGGYFACGSKYIHIDDTSNVTFKDGYVLDTKESSARKGYYTLVKKEDLAGKNEETGESYTYQDFEGKATGGYGSGLNQLLEDAGNFDNSDSAYPADVWSAFSDALEAASRVTQNANANQLEIDYRAANLTKAIQALESMTDLDVTDLADGTYSIEVELYKTTLAGKSMASGALDGAAVLKVEEGKASLSMNFKPTFTSGMWGRLLQAWLYEGDTPAKAKAASADYKSASVIEAEYSNYYAHTGESAGTADVTYRWEAEDGKDGYTDAYCYPGTVTIPMPYLGTDSDYSTLYLRLGVDAMRAIASEGLSGDANVLAILKWSTLTAIDTKATLSVGTDAVSLIAGDAQTVTAKLKAADGYALEWKSSDENIAAVAPGEDSTATVTAVAEGECTITATASKEGEDPLTKTVKVTVAAQDSAPVKVESVTAEGTAARAVLSGDVLVTNGAGEGVSVEASEVTVAAAAEGDNITSAEVVIPDSVAEALKAKNTTITTDVGSVKLDSALMTQIASMSEISSDTVTLEISKAELPAASLGTYSDAYEITLVDKDGKTVEFGSGKAAVTISCSDSNVLYAYYIKDGKRAERQTVTYDETAKTASFTTTHFSLWALSANEYAVDSGSSSEGSGSGGGNGGTTTDFFLSDGNYYVDIDLWKAASNEQSMGHVAFKNNDRALVTVKNGKVTTVRIATNPVDVDQYHSAITSFEVDDADVTVLKKGSVTTKPAGKDYEYIQMVEFQMPSVGQPDIADATTYVPVTFWVPDTPMDAAVGEELNARLKFIWSTASKTSDTSLNANSSSASGSSSITGEDIKSLTLTDKATGIKLETNTERLSDKAEMTVSKLASGADYDTAVKAMEGVSKEWSLYKIDTAVDGKSTAPEGSVTLSFPCGTEELTIYRISDSGTKTVLKGSVKDGYYVLSTSQLGMFAVLGDISDDIPVVVPEGEFADVQNHWAKEYVNAVVQRGLFNGVSDTQFSPNTSMTRAMFVTVLGRLAGADVGSAEKTAFTDVKEGSWYASYVSWGVDNGIVKGVSDTSFAPDQTITRQEMAVFLSRYAEFAKITLKDGASVNFADSGDISAYAADAVSQMAKAGLLNGVGDNKFAPKNTATRAEVAALLARFIGDYSL